MHAGATLTNVLAQVSYSEQLIFLTEAFKPQTFCRKQLIHVYFTLDAWLSLSLVHASLFCLEVSSPAFMFLPHRSVEDPGTIPAPQSQPE